MVIHLFEVRVSTVEPDAVVGIEERALPFVAFNASPDRYASLAYSSRDCYTV